MKPLFTLLLLLPWAVSALAAPQFRIIPLQHRLAEELLPVIRPLAGDNGTVSAYSNQLIVNVEPEAMASIEAAVRGLDVTRRNWHITVSHSAAGRLNRSTTGAAGTAGGKVQVQVPDARGRIPRDITIKMQETSRDWSDNRSMDLTTLDGEAAFIRVGQEVPYTSYWIELCRRYARVVQTTQWRDVSVGFAVRPRQTGDMVDLEITPRLAAAGQNGIVDFTELSSHIQARPGEWVNLGGMLGSRDEVSRAILNNSGSDGSFSSRLRVRVD